MASFLKKKNQIHQNGGGGCTGSSPRARATMSKFSSLSSFITSYRHGVPELIQLGDDSADLGNFEDSLTHYNNALEKERHTASGASSIQTALILHKIGLALAQTGDSFAAMNSFEEALEIRQEKLGPGSEESAQTTAEMNKILDDIRVQSGVGERRLVKGENGQATTVDMGTNLLEWGEYKEAEVVLKECLENMNDEDDTKCEERIKVLGAMAELDRAQGKYDEAKEHYLEVLKTAKKMNTDPDEELDMSIINSIAGYAEILRKAGDLWQAEAMHKKVRNMLIASKVSQEGMSPEMDLHLAVSHTQLGCTVFALKKYEDALREHQSALNLRLRVLEVTDALVSESFNYCAETLCDMGREAEALPLSLQAVDIRAREFGTSHPAYAHALCILSKCYHGVGRSRDAKPLIQKCLQICEQVFSENHANLIPNLIVQGDILQEVGELETALSVLQRAESIHKRNFNSGQKDLQLKDCQAKMNGVLHDIKNAMDFRPSQRRHNAEQEFRGGTPIIVVTDIGLNIDDALALVMLSSLKKMHILNPIAVITTLAPNKDRACLARTILDSLGMHDVPVGFGADVACQGDITLHCFGGVANQNPYEFERGSHLMERLLYEAEDKSVKLLCISNLRDISELIVKQEELFRTKVKEVVMMGGAAYSVARGQVIPDDTAFNNSSDLEASRHVYAECQQKHIPTTTVSRYAAYGCPLSTSFLDGLQKTNHLLAGEIRDANLKAMQSLWRKVNMPSWMPGRAKLPARCNKTWFLNFFQVDVNDDTYTKKEIWKGSTFYLYDSLAMLSCADVYVDLHFRPAVFKVDRTPHRVIGFIDENRATYSGVVNSDSLVDEIDGLLKQALKLSLEGMDAPRKYKTEEIPLLDESKRSADSGNNGRDSASAEYDEKKTESSTISQ